MVPVTELTVRRLMPLAARGLARWGINGDDAGRLLALVEQRCLKGRNGATWQVRNVHELQRRGLADRSEALRLMTQGYIEGMNSGEPVHSWPML